jgi:hypothetical protein
MRVVVRDPERPLVHVELAEENGTCISKLPDDRRILIGNARAVEFRARCGAHAGRIEEILERDRDTGQRSTRLAAGDLELHGARIAHRLIGGDRDERVHFGVARGYPLETCRRKLDGRRLAGCDPLRRAEKVE